MSKYAMTFVRSLMVNFEDSVVCVNSGAICVLQSESEQEYVSKHRKKKKRSRSLSRSPPLSSDSGTAQSILRPHTVGK